MQDGAHAGGQQSGAPGPGDGSAGGRVRWILFLAVATAALGLAGLTGWYLVRIGSATEDAYRSIFVTPAPRPSVGSAVPGTPRPTMAPTTLRLPTPTATPTPFPEWEGREPILLLLIGIDSTPERAGEGALPLADALVLVQIDPVAKRAVLLSIPRDLLVDIPGVGWDRINAAYAMGETRGVTGPVLTMRTVERNFGVVLDGFIVVDFQGFVRIVDLLGGVVVDVPAPIKDDRFPGPSFTYRRLYFAPGLQRLEGERALAYVRTRHDDNDLARGLRQQQVLRALRAQALRVQAIRRIPDLLAALGDTVRTDLRPGEALALARLGLELSPDRIQSASLVRFVHDATLPNGAAVLAGDWPGIRTEVDRLFGGTGAEAR